MKISLPAPTTRQLGLLALLLLVPFGLAIATIVLSDDANQVTGWFLTAFGVVMLGAICGSMLLRRSIVLDPDQMIVRHSFYTLRIHRSEAGTVTVVPLGNMEWLSKAYRTLGTAAFGYLSGWFWLPMNATGFCAVSQGPMYQVDFQREGRPATLALSCSSQVADAIRTWAGA